MFGVLKKKKNVRKGGKKTEWLKSDFVYTDANVFETAQGCILGSETAATEQGEEAAAAATSKM